VPWDDKLHEQVAVCLAVREGAILEAMAELDRWRERARTLGPEHPNVQRQIAYYEALLREMKRDVRPPRFEDLLRAL
jgi:hypothetical protein